MTRKMDIRVTERTTFNSPNPATSKLLGTVEHVGYTILVYQTADGSYMSKVPQLCIEEFSANKATAISYAKGSINLLTF